MEWVDRHSGEEANLPLTHITKGIVAHDIIKAGRIEPKDCDVFRVPLPYFFYGRPAYRYSAGSSIKLEASCPFCFIFDGKLLARAKRIYPFDTGAFAARMYNHILDEDLDVADFSLGTDPERPEKLISASFLTRRGYVKGDRNEVRNPSLAAKPYELEARSYLELLRSAGRNEPDDRIGTIEVQFGDPVPLAGSLLAVVVPDTQWIEGDHSPLLDKLHTDGVEILIYEFIPGRPLEHYHTLLEVTVRDYCLGKGFV